MQAVIYTVDSWDGVREGGEEGVLHPGRGKRKRGKKKKGKMSRRSHRALRPLQRKGRGGYQGCLAPSPTRYFGKKRGGEKRIVVSFWLPQRKKREEKRELRLIATGYFRREKRKGGEGKGRRRPICSSSRF